MATDRQQFIQACRLLGVEFKEDPQLTLSNGTIIAAQIHVANFSSRAGIWVADFDDESRRLWRAHRTEIAELGASASFMSLNAESNAPFDLNNFIDMFSEWGWTGAEEETPSWIIPFERLYPSEPTEK